MGDKSRLYAALATGAVYGFRCLWSRHFLHHLSHSYAVADPASDTATGWFTYLVHYPGPAENEQAWLDHYLVKHAPLVANLPDVRAVTVDTPAVIVSGLPFRSAGALLRNKAVFDSAKSLSAALSSPSRDALQADAASFPRFAGGSVHIPMETLVVTPARAA